MTQEEWDEMNVLRKAMTDNLASVHPDKQERFTELLIKSWPAQGEHPLDSGPGAVNPTAEGGSPPLLSP